MRKKAPLPPQETLGLYVHIPFCKSKCAYCDFYSLAGQDARMDPYLKVLLAHIREGAEAAEEMVVDTIYVGGGTPSYFGAKRLKTLLSEIRKRYDVDKAAEITVEVNPDSADPKELRVLRKAGFNRISLGMQSACPEELRDIGRPHTVEQTRAAVEAARKAKFDNLSLDLIYGLPGQSMDRWQANVEAAIALEPEHLSCYGLKVEQGTPLATRVANGEQMPDDDLQADMYLWAVDRLAEAGYAQYEISNFAREGRESRHNLKYWLMHPYIGFGPGAHSDFGTRRYSFVRDLDAYMDGFRNGKPILDENELIPQRERGSEYLMLRLRLTRGIEEWEYRSNYFMDFTPIESRLQQFAEKGWAEKTEEGRWHLTPRGFLVSNALICELQESQEQSLFSELLPRARERFSSDPA